MGGLHDWHSFRALRFSHSGRAGCRGPSKHTGAVFLYIIEQASSSPFPTISVAPLACLPGKSGETRDDGEKEGGVNEGKVRGDAVRGKGARVLQLEPLFVV